MLASLPASEPPLVSDSLVYEPKYDGIRAIALVEPGKPYAKPRFWSRLGNEKTAQFPELAAALGVWGRGLSGPVVLDGEIVALDREGTPGGVSASAKSDSRHRSLVSVRTSRSSATTNNLPPSSPSTSCARATTISARCRWSNAARGWSGCSKSSRRRLRRCASVSRSPATAAHSSPAPRPKGWEGLLVKHARSVYRDGRRSPEWQKLKINQQDEFVVGGWTEPKGARAYFGSLILGRYDESGELVHVGDVGTGFGGAELERLWKLLKPRRSQRVHSPRGRKRWASRTG